MYRAVVVCLVLLVLVGSFNRAEAKLIPYRKLTVQQRMDLEASEQRMAALDRQMQSLELRHRHGQINRRDYTYEVRDLTAYISAEAHFQNNILVDQRPVPSEDAIELMQNVLKYGFVYPGAAILFLVAHAGPFSYSH